MTTTTSSRIDLPTESLAAFCRRWNLARLEIFGSVLRDDFGEGSDVDLLYTPGPRFNPELAFGPWGRNRMAEELAEIVGRPVDLVARSQVERHRNWIRRQHILQTAQPIYVEGQSTSECRAFSAGDNRRVDSAKVCRFRSTPS